MMKKGQQKKRSGRNFQSPFSSLSLRPSPLYVYPCRSFIMSMYSVDDVYRPSFFELVAAERLIIGLKPALKHILTVLSRRSDLFLTLVRYNEEVFHLLLYFLEKHYLEQYEGSFSENFYGLKRVRITPQIHSSSFAGASSSSLPTSSQLFTTASSSSPYYSSLSSYQKQSSFIQGIKKRITLHKPLY